MIPTAQDLLNKQREVARLESLQSEAWGQIGYHQRMVDEATDNWRTARYRIEDAAKELRELEQVILEANENRLPKIGDPRQP